MGYSRYCQTPLRLIENCRYRESRKTHVVDIPSGISLTFARCEAVLGEFLKSVKEQPSEVDIRHMVNVLIVHAQAKGIPSLL